MLAKITMPSGGTNTDQLRVVSWKKQAGDPVKRGDILLEVETDKAVLEVESFAKGTALSVSTSSRMSPRLTGSPTCFFHEITRSWSVLVPPDGIVILASIYSP